MGFVVFGLWKGMAYVHGGVFCSVGCFFDCCIN